MADACRQYTASMQVPVSLAFPLRGGFFLFLFFFLAFVLSFLHEECDIRVHCETMHSLIVLAFFAAVCMVP